MAETDAEELRDSVLIDAYWSYNDFILAFSNGRWLHVFISGDDVRWRVVAGEPVLRGKPQLRSGAPPILLDWGNGESYAMNVSGLVADRIGAAFKGLFVNDPLFFVYFRGRLVLQLNPVFRIDTGESLLCLSETD